LPENKLGSTILVKGNKNHYLFDFTRINGIFRRFKGYV